MIRRDPAVPLEFVEALAVQHYGLDARAERLTGERDENFRLHVPHGEGYVLKLANAGESVESTRLALAALRYVAQAAPSIPCPRVVPSRSGHDDIRVIDSHGRRRTAAVVTFLPGKPLLAVQRTSEQRRACGRLLALLGKALRDFDAPGADRAIAWDLRRLPSLAGVADQLADLPEPGFCRDFIRGFAATIAPRLSVVRHQFVHNDFNGRNVLVDPTLVSRVTGVIDFGDSVRTALVIDVAVGAVGQLETPATALDAVREFAEAYAEIEPLEHMERSLLRWLIAGRIVQSVVLTSWHRSQDPNGAHFGAFDHSFFGWRIEFARRLIDCRADSPLE